MKFLSDVLAKAGLVVDGVVTFNNTATGQTPAANDNSTKLATTAWVRNFVTPYSLPIASASTLGGVKVGSGLAIDGTGILSVSASGVGAIRALQQITATSGQTVFTVSGGYTPGLIDVFLNGVLLTPTAITATNGTTFTLADAAVVNDLLDIFVYNPIYNGFITSTDQVPEGSVNLYFTSTRARAAISLTVTGSSGASSYSSSTGVLNVPTYTLDGLGGVPTSRTLTINGVTYDLTANRSWSALPTGGIAGQLLAKVDGTDYNAQWVNEAPAASYTSQVKHVVKSSQAITKGQAVYVSSADGTNMIVSKASNATEGTSSKTMGLLESTVSTNGFANVITEGLLAGLNTNGANAGDPVWLGTDGNLIYGLLNKPSAPAHLVFIGVVTRANANNGEIFVKVQNGFEMRELHDYVESGVQNNFVISYESSTSLYKPKSIATLLGYTPANAARNLTINGTTYDLTVDRTWTLTTSVIAEGTNLYYTDTRVGTYLTANSYATQSYVGTQIANLVASAPSTLDTLNELALALGNDPNFATTVATSIGTKVPQTRTLTINGTSYDLSADRSWTIASGVTSFNTRTGAIISASGDYTTAQVTESGNLYYTDARARLAISLTTTGTSGAATYDNVTGVLNIPQYQGGVTSFNTRTGAITLSSTDVTTALGYTPVTNARTLTINGETYDLTANRTWTVGVNPSARTIQTYTATASQTTFTVTGGYVVGLVDVFINGVRLTSADFTATNGTTVVLTTGTGVNNIVDVIKYTSAFTASSALRQVTYFTATAGQTTFTVSYTPGLIDVFYNGSKLASSEYTASNGTTVVLTNAAVLNDALEIIAYAYSVGAFTGQAQLNGTGFVKVNGTTVTYDNSTYLTTSSASSTYQTILTNPVTGTATSGQVAYWSSSSAITGGSNFLFNSSESNLTIDRSLSTLGNAITISKGSDANQAWLAFRQGGGGNGTWRLGYTGDPYDFTINVGTDSSIGTQTLRIFEDSQNVVIGTSTGDNASRLQVGGGATFTGNVGIGTTTPTASFNGRLSVRNEDAANNPTLVLFKNINSASSEDIFRVQSWNGAFNTVASIKANGSANFSSNVTANGLNALGSSLNNGNTIRFYRAGLVEMGYIGWSNENANNSTWLFKSSNGNPIAFSADGTNQQLVVNTNGNVLIGTTTDAAYKLDVNGTTILRNNVFTTGENGIELGWSGSTINDQRIGRIRPISTPSQNPYAGGLAFDYYRYNISSYQFLEGMRLNGSGNLLIGTTTDNGSRFQVTGSNSGSLPLLNLVASGTGTYQRGVRLLNSGMNSGDHIMYSVGQADNARNMGQFYFQYNSSGSTSNRVSLGLHSVDDVLNIMGTGNVLIGTLTDLGTRLNVNGTTYSTNYISDTQGLNVSGYGFLNQTLSGQMTILGHNVSASSSVNNQTYVVNGGWYSSMIKMYYSEGITFHTSTTVYSAGAVYPMADTERVKIQNDGQVVFQSSIILRNGQVNSLTSGGGGQSMYLNFAGNGAIYAGSSYAVLYAGSDERIKTEINHSQSTLSKILNLIPRTFKYKERPELTYYGFIAQEVEKVMPELVRVSEGITMCLDEEIENQKSVESYGLVWASILVKAIQELKAELDELKSKN